jgi:serine/threonine protein kinase
VLQGSVLESADLTRAGQMIGTFDYMAPEQMLGGDTTGRTDIFALGILLYEMLCGELPFGAAQTSAQVLYHLLHVTPVPPSTRVDSPVALDRVLERCLHHDPAQRYAEIAELAGDLDRLADVTDPSKTRQMPAAGTAASSLDDMTWIDRPPPPVGLHTTLPGIVPPDRRAKWPLDAPPKKPRR